MGSFHYTRHKFKMCMNEPLGIAPLFQPMKMRVELKMKYGCIGEYFHSFKIYRTHSEVGGTCFYSPNKFSFVLNNLVTLYHFYSFWFIL